MTDERCATCRFWKELDPSSDCGECHRHAPVPFPVFSDRLITDSGVPECDRQITQCDILWPWTMTEFWCGEYQPKEQKKSKEWTTS